MKISCLVYEMTNDPKQQRCQWQMTAESKQIKKICIEWVTWNYGSLTVSINTNRGKVAGRQIYSYTHANLDRCQAQSCLYNAGNWPDTETFLTHQGGGGSVTAHSAGSCQFKIWGFLGWKKQNKDASTLSPRLLAGSTFTRSGTSCRLTWGAIWW